MHHVPDDVLDLVDFDAAFLGLAFGVHLDGADNHDCHYHLEDKSLQGRVGLSIVDLIHHKYPCAALKIQNLHSLYRDTSLRMHFFLYRSSSVTSQP